MITKLRKARLRAGDEGYTLTEMIVVIFILGIVLAAVQTTLVMTNRTVGDNGRRIDQTQQARVAIESMSRLLRTAVLPSQLNGTCTTCDTSAFIQGTGTSVQFYANVNNDANTIGPSRVTYVVTATGDLTETVQPPNAHAVNDYNYQYCTPGPGCVVTTRTLARNVAAGASVPALFNYYDKTGTKFTSATLTASQLASVDSIDVLITVKGAAAQSIHGTTLTQRVTLPNADSVAEPSS